MNIEAPILGGNGRPIFSVGGEGAARTFTAGDYMVSLEWLNETRSSEPAMVIVPKDSPDAGAFAIALSSIGRYADPSGNCTNDPQAWMAVWRALKVMGRAQLDVEAHRLMDVILRHAPDLIRMPPCPRELRLADQRAPLLEITRYDENTGKRISEDLV